MTEEMSVERKRAGKKNEAVKMHRPEEVKGASVHITACSGEVWREERHWQGAMQCDEIANFVDYKKEAAFSVVVDRAWIAEGQTTTQKPAAAICRRFQTEQSSSMSIQSELLQKFSPFLKIEQEKRLK